MWVFTDDGFFSTVVWHFDGTVVGEWLAVRSRAEDNLISFLNKMDGAYTTDDIICSPDRDYPWRILVRREDWAKYLSDYVTDDLFYGDFKNHIRRVGPHSASFRRMHALGDVWSIMFDYEDRPESGPVELGPSAQAGTEFRNER